MIVIPRPRVGSLAVHNRVGAYADLRLAQRSQRSPQAPHEASKAF
ncbi:hypothetical protein FEMY_24890 [Ferrovum myxofaciens]|uniref:Uncharacterized protein n=1 Tax=Ferrovum myxofaciens TaxID=416213 RepID=A0A149VUT5_9PROT|nr:hypothetical protein FEMY_24890 [Ferrovum myxofaciens]